ncbi:urease accessory protein UreE [Lichenifustis flavocetrariae]|uniref:Urease accessory protein UreE n=1 Tax=Lichenifustis flavocetrariae TaxID=2949735 RepID=A0AA41YUJ6_9HYPH|nr:urease accessory protein UreE [Lichenifustis flavocetrariae]MCW6507451.1 urease accessory protein UreE [Lichenifustis flavocetrariae]
MLRLHGIVGHEADAGLHDRLHHVEHHGGIEFLFVPPEEAGRKRFRRATDRGTDCAVSLDRDEDLIDGALLWLEHDRAIIVRFGQQALWRLRPINATAALKLGWHAGNLHWRVRFEGECLVILLDGPPADYRARIAHLLAEGDIVDLADV